LFQLRLERVTTERRMLTNRQTAAKTLNQKILLQKVNGELSPEDFAILKENVTQEKAEVEAQLNVLDAESSTVQALIGETQNNIVNLYKAWQNGDTANRRELAFGLYPEGLGYSPETKFFEPHNTLLMNSVHQMFASFEAESNFGVPDGI